MVDFFGAPPFPRPGPDPKSSETFAKWIRAITATGRVTQKQIADIAGASPQAVTKWLKGGAIEAERLVRLAEWSGFSYDDLRRLVEEPKLRLLYEGLSVSDTPGSYALAKAAKGQRDDFMAIFRRLTPENQDVVFALATALLSKQPRDS